MRTSARHATRSRGPMSIAAWGPSRAGNRQAIAVRARPTRRNPFLHGPFVTAPYRRGASSGSPSCGLSSRDKRGVMAIVRSIVGLIVCLASSTFAAEPSAAIRIEATQPTAWGESVYVLGDRAELGAGDTTRAVRMRYVGPSRWALDVALPAGAAYRYVLLVRDNAPGRLGDARNGRTVSGVISGRAPGSTARAVRVRYLSGFQAPRLRVERQGAVDELAMTRVGAGRGPGESLWEARLTSAERDVAFTVVDGATGRTDRAPGGGVYRTTRADLVLCDGQVLPDLPPARRSPSRVVRVSSWYSQTLGNARDVFVYLPRDYDGSTRRYPVIYAHDGQNLFGPDALFGGWRLELALDRGIASGAIEDVIVVGPANTNARMSEYMPPQEQGGAGDRYAEFLVRELKPWVDRTFRTRPEAAQTATMGSSLGGLISFYLGWERSDVFGRAASLSGSFWLDGHLKAIEGEARPAGLTRLWLDSGTAGSSADSCEDTLRARDLLLGQGAVLGRDVQHRVDSGAGHNEAAWRGRVGDVLAWLFPAE
jgi:predicted alpha/beta superfamily hydrolase